MPQPRVTVLMPIYNAEASLAASLHSILAQCPVTGARPLPLPSFEILLVDDGSTDSSPEIAAGFCRHYPCVRLLRRPHQGIAPALNAGLAAAQGEYIARMDADDSAHPERLARQTAHLDNRPDLEISASRVLFGGDAAQCGGFAYFVTRQNSLLGHEDLARNCFRDTPICHPSVMFRRRAVTAAGGYAHGDFPEDWELWLRLFEAGARMEKLPQTLLTWNDSPHRATRADARYREAACNALRARYLARRLARCNPFHPFVWVLGAGRVARRRLAPLWEQGIRPAGFIDIDPHKIGNAVKGVPVLPRSALPPPGGCLILNALTAHGAAEEAGQWLQGAGYSPTESLLA